MIVLFAGVSGWILIPATGVMGAAWASVIGTSVMLSGAKMLCGDDEKLTDGIALICIATCYFLSIGSLLAVIGLLTMIPAWNSIDYLRSRIGIAEEE